MRIKTTKGTSITPQRAAAAIISDALSSVWYYPEQAQQSMGSISEVDDRKWDAVAGEMRKLLGPIEACLDAIAKDVTTAHVDAHLAHDPAGCLVYEQTDPTKVDSWQMYKYVPGKARPVPAGWNSES